MSALVKSELGGVQLASINSNVQITCYSKIGIAEALEDSEVFNQFYEFQDCFSGYNNIYTPELQFILKVMWNLLVWISLSMQQPASWTGTTY